MAQALKGTLNKATEDTLIGVSSFFIEAHGDYRSRPYPPIDATAVRA